jgi:hypothetical protein
VKSPEGELKRPPDSSSNTPSISFKVGAASASACDRFAAVAAAPVAAAVAQVERAAATFAAFGNSGTAAERRWNQLETSRRSALFS